MRRLGLLGVLLASAALAAPARGPIGRTSRAGQPWWHERVEMHGASADAAIAERAVRAYLAQHIGRLAPGASPGDFTLLANHVDHRGLRTVTFQQRFRGMRVIDGSLGFVIGRDRMFAVRARALPNVSASVPAGLPAGERVVIQHAGGYAVAAVRETPEATEYVGPRGEVLGRRTKIMTASATLEFNVGARHGAGARATFPAPDAAILLNGGSAFTDAEGAFSWSGTAPSTVVAGIDGTYVRVINSAGASAMRTFPSVAPGATIVWDASGNELEDAQVSTYVYANIAKQRARIVNPAVTAYLDEQTEFHVNEVGACNAYSTGDSVHLFRSSPGCANTGLVGDVVFHEFGHSLHNQSIIEGVGAFDEHLSEGLADFFASNITGDPAMGRGFFKTEEPLRQIDPPGYERVYPQDFDFDPHVSGLIIGGALWDLRKRLVTELGPVAGIAQTEAIFTGIMQRADDISTSFTAALIADDDDADLGNGTPNYCAIETAFGRHGLVPGLALTTVATPEIVGRQLRVRVTTPSGTTCAPIGVTSIQVTWTANDGVPGELSLVASGDDWTGELPEQPDGTLLTYSLDVTFADGSLTTFPNNPADPRYQLYLGEVTPLWCETFDADPGWEETSNAGREWQWGPLLVDPTSPDPDAPYTGTSAFGTDVSSNGAYRANLMTSIVTPAIAIPAFETVRLQYRRWLTVEDATYDQATIEANGTEVFRNASAPNGTLDHVDREWRYHDIDITPWIGDGTLQLAWKLDTDFGKELGGWTIDDVCVVGVGKIAVCGDGTLDVDEQCDDGNRETGDGCDDTCLDEVTAGGGGCCSSSHDANGAWLLALGVLGLLVRRRRA